MRRRADGSENGVSSRRGRHARVGAESHADSRTVPSDAQVLGVMTDAAATRRQEKSFRDERDRASVLIAEAEALGIPWQTILAEEILAERMLQRGIGEPPTEWPLSCIFYLLPSSLLQSWRVRERLDRLSWEARAEGSREAAAELRGFYGHLSGKRTPSAPMGFFMASHLWLGYRRVLELQRIARIAEKARGDDRKSLDQFSRRMRCSTADAEWAFERVRTGKRSHSLDDAMRRARDEGFELPRARSELKAFLRVKVFLRRRGFLKPGPAPGNPPALAVGRIESRSCEPRAS